MELEKIWGEMNEKAGDQSRLPGQFPWERDKSLHPLVQVRRNLLKTNVSGILISLGYIVLMVWYPVWPLLLGFSIVLVFNTVFIYQGIVLRRGLPATVDPSHSMLAEMKIQYAAIQKWVNNQMYAARFVYPVAAATGFMLGGMLGSGKPLEALFVKPVFPIVMLVSMVAFAFAGLWLAKKLFQIAYGKHLEGLQQNIDILESQAKETEQ